MTKLSFIIALALGIFLFTQFSYAEVFIPEKEYVGYFDSDGIYTVVGAIRNWESYPIIPTISITILDGDEIITKDFPYVNIMPSKDLPFKFKFPEVKTSNPILKEPEIDFIVGVNQDPGIEVIYDNSLVVHSDGHVTGRVINTSEKTISDVKILAVIHGKENVVLDVGQNAAPITNLQPGEITEFSMYPDSSVSSQVLYYSCFAPSDSTVIPVSTTRNDERFFFRYDSGAWYAYAEFNDKGTDLTMRMQNSYPIETYANFEFPVSSKNEKFDVTLNGEKVDFIQSIDEMGNWHVAYTVEPYSNGVLKISGFNEHYEFDNTVIPLWVKDRAAIWSSGMINEQSFIYAVNFLIDENFVNSNSVNDLKIPKWFKNSAGWWSQGLITDEEFTKSLEFLIQNQIFN